MVARDTERECVLALVPFDLVAHFIAEHFEETIFPAIKAIHSPQQYLCKCSNRDQLVSFLTFWCRAVYYAYALAYACLIVLLME